ncbi:hypothetical protein CKO25_07445 [Thiocapsa imhoffii]|uniref:Ankyrin repeat domain-containing protein n=2 Tax=Thiocapsa imhoffii TaxID=382777 RepID=A0A9X0WH37_9GAMM|nr:hypothetical protein [Thiocapsa imhoffii]
MVVMSLSLVACTEPAAPTVGLNRAVEIGDLDQIKRHAYWKSDLNKRNAAGETPLHVAARAGRVAIVRELVRNGADLSALDAAGQSVLYVALAHGRTQVAQQLIERGAALQAQSMLIELSAAGVIDRDAIALLIRRGATLEGVDEAGDTALHAAIKHGHLETVRRLIIAGANVNQPDGDGRLPLRIARESAPGSDARFIQSTLERNGAIVELPR